MFCFGCILAGPEQRVWYKDLSPVQTSKFSLTSFLTSSLTRMYDEQVFLDKFNNNNNNNNNNNEFIQNPQSGYSSEYFLTMINKEIYKIYTMYKVYNYN